MLATLTDERFSRQGWLFEPKWDGERCLAFRRDGSLRVLSRNRILLNDKYPEITAALDRHRGRRLLSKRRVARAGRG
jgi:ATP-dependent DNA ligase